MRNGINRRQKNSSAATIEHAVELMRTHGASYASRYLTNRGIAAETITRVLTDNPSARRSLPRSSEGHVGWGERNSEVQQVPIRQLNYKARGKTTRER